MLNFRKLLVETNFTHIIETLHIKISRIDLLLIIDFKTNLKIYVYMFIHKQNLHFDFGYLIGNIEEGLTRFSDKK